MAGMHPHHPPLDCLEVTSAGFAAGLGHAGAAEPGGAAAGEGGEGLTPGWEAAWIDLGGEG